MALTQYKEVPARGASLAVLTGAESVANTTTPTGLTAVTIPANGLSVGDVIELEARGVLSTTGTPTLNVGTYVNAAATAGVTGTMTQGSGVANEPFSVRALGTVRSVGATGTISWNILFQLDGATDILKLVVGTTADTVNTTADMTFALYFTWSAASASNTLTVHQYEVKRR
jgi:hypothetical protein